MHTFLQQPSINFQEPSETLIRLKMNEPHPIHISGRSILTQNLFFMDPLHSHSIKWIRTSWLVGIFGTTILGMPSIQHHILQATETTLLVPLDSKNFPRMYLGWRKILNSRSEARKFILKSVSVVINKLQIISKV